MMLTTPISDKPGPGRGLVLLMSAFLALFLVLIPVSIRWQLLPLYKGLILASLAVLILVLLYGFYMVFNTSYLLDQDGIRIKFGFAEDYYIWNEFSEIQRRQGVFTLKIGWRGISPCVRLMNAIQLRRKGSRLSLYLTPTDPDEMIKIISQLEPRLTH